MARFRRLFLSFIYIAVDLALLGAWHYRHQNPDSIWFMLAAVFLGFVTLLRIKAEFLHVPIVLAIGFGWTWYHDRQVGEAVWALMLCVVASVAVLSQLNQLWTDKKPAPAAVKKII